MTLRTIAMAILWAAPWAFAADGAATPQQFQQAMAARADELKKANTVALAGQDGFYFLASEIRHYGRGPFWGVNAAKASAAEEDPDPLVCILDFNAQLKKAGVKLIVMPVPGKPAVYPDKLDPKLASRSRLDVSHQEFFELLRKDGIQVVDLLPDMLALREKGIRSHCLQDAHWTPDAMKLAAMRAADLVKKEAWYAGVAKRQYKMSSEPVKFTGDTVGLLESLTKKALGLPPEAVTVEKVSDGAGKVASDKASPLILMGDSHCIVYHEPIEGGINASDAGLFEHVAAQLGFAPELLANMGSGANPPRFTLARRKDNLAGRKCIIWCLAAREFTESSQGWMKCPVVR